MIPLEEKSDVNESTENDPESWNLATDINLSDG
jgi:hypothetical protein